MEVCSPTATAGAAAHKAKVEKTPEQVQKDIQDIMRQITSSVTFLPSLEEKCESDAPLCSLITGLSDQKMPLLGTT